MVVAVAGRVGIVAIVAGLVVRRIFPRAGYLAVVAGTTAFLAAGGPYGPALLAPALAVLALATTLPLRGLGAAGWLRCRS